MYFKLPKPPSTNHIYGYTSRGGFARSYITKKGVAWFTEAGYLINTQRTSKEPITTPVSITIELHTAFRQDIDGILKPTLDILQKQGILENDSLVSELHVRKIKTTKLDQHITIAISDYS